MFVFFVPVKENISKLKFEGIVILYKFQFSFDSKQLYRLSYIIRRNFNYSEYYLGNIVLAETEKFSECTRIEFENIYTDCDELFHNFLRDNPTCIGCSSQFVNNILIKLLNIELLVEQKIDYQGDIVINQLEGDNGWRNLSHYFEMLKESNIKYVILRKFDLFPDDFIDNDHDIDILCEDRDMFAFVSNAVHRSIGISGYKIIIEGKDISLDIRYIGDNYYDSKWEQDIINSRVLYKNFYLPDKNNLYFSILYHVFTQKKYIPEYYCSYIDQLEVHIWGLSINNHDRLKVLINYMKIRNYYYVKPYDYSVEQNALSICAIKTLKSQHAFKIRLGIRIFNFLHGHPSRFVKKFLKDCDI